MLCHNFLARYILVYTNTGINMSGTVHDGISRHMTVYYISVKVHTSILYWYRIYWYIGFSWRWRTGRSRLLWVARRRGGGGVTAAASAARVVVVAAAAKLWLRTRWLPCRVQQICMVVPARPPS
jgi:hypothetical protein